ncbi:hypothetical protein YTPLAS18_29590 [Nitrospira sp.]|nr:hypothetical protein YTPLAS18_29590 [Nitrospira sp.]
MSSPIGGGRIFTFYSYKGGTGRSMALANLAWVLAANRRRVLIVDWDLEAPGLHRYFHPFLADKELATSRGLIDLLVDYSDQAIQPPEGDEGDNWYQSLTDLSPYLQGINFDGFPEGGRIDLVPAGRQGPAYATKLHAFDWDTFYERLGGGAFLEAIKKRLRRDYDYVLIDSRTGVSDTAGICTVQMPDTLVIMFTYNNQSIHGALAVARSAIEIRRRDYGQFSNETFRVFPVPSRADPFEVLKLERRQAFARKLFAPLLEDLQKSEHNAYWAGVEVPYNAFLNYEEVLSPLIFNPDDPKLPMVSVLRLASYVTDGDISRYDLPLAPDKKQQLVHAYEQVEELSAEAAATTQTPKIEESQMDALLRGANTVLGQLTVEQLDLAKRLLLRLVRVPRGQEAPGLKRLLLPLQHVSAEERSLMERFVRASVLRKVQVKESSSSLAVKLADGDWLARWRQINDWAAEEKVVLEQRDWIQTAFEHWQRNGRPDSLLLARPVSQEAKQLLVAHAPLFTVEEIKFIKISEDFWSKRHASQAQRKMFLSCVSAEFRSYREVLRRTLTRPNISIAVQEDFIVTGTETLDLLDDYIRQCDAVIHIVGDMTGPLAQASSLAVIRQYYPDLGQKLAPVAPFLAPQAPALSYTQWEAWLALYHGKPLVIGAPDNNAPRDERFELIPEQRAAQQAHLQRLAEVECYPFRFASSNSLAIEVLRSELQDILELDTPLTRPANLPFLSLGELFKGREATLNDLGQSLGPIPDSHTTSVEARVLIGLGGVGKTRLALEYAWRHADDYTALLFVRADSAEALRSGVAALSAPNVLNIPEKLEGEEVKQYEAVLHWLRQHSGWLLIFDQVDSKPAAAAVEALLPQLVGGHLLITSRLADWSAGLAPVALDLLAPEAATDYLLARTDAKRRKHPADPDTARVLADKLGCLALALEQASAYIAQRRLSFDQYLVHWQSQRDKVLTWYDGRLMQYPQSIAISWQTSFDRLTASAKHLLRRLAWIAPDPIPESLLEVSIPGGEGQVDPFESLAELESYSLVARAVGSPTFTVHRLVQEVTRRSMREDREQDGLFEVLHWLDTAFAGFDPTNPGDWPMLAPLLPHVRAVSAHADAAGIREPTALLMSQAGLLLYAKGQYAEAEPLLQRALAICEQALGPEHPDVARSLNNLALLYHTQGAYVKAEPLYHRALAIYEHALGPEHPNVARSLNNLALLYHTQGAYAKAEPLYHRALAICEQALGPEHPDVARSLNNLAELYRAQGAYPKAEPLYERALAIYEHALGPEHPDVARSLNNLAELYRAQGAYPKAEPLLQRALAICEQALGPEHPDVARSLNNLAELYRAQGAYPKAEPLYERALAIYEHALGPEHPDVARSLNNLAELYRTQGAYPKAEPLYERALTSLLVTLGTKHPSSQTVLNNYKDLLQLLDKTESEIIDTVRSLMENTRSSA